MKRSKYRSVRTTVDGHNFHSKAEAARYLELKLLQKAGKIHHLHLQPRFPLFIGDHLICTYVADFSYYEDETYIVEDVKGFHTQTYKLKKALLFALEGLTILET